jgi:hypothetical protein
MPVMRCPPYAMSAVMDALIIVPVESLVAHPTAGLCSSEKSINQPNTQIISPGLRRLRRIAPQYGYHGKSSIRPPWASKGDDGRSGDIKRCSGNLSGHHDRRSRSVEGDGQDTSKATVRTRRARKPGRPCRPPFRFRPRRDHANDAPFRPRSPARRCGRSSRP